MKVIKVCEPFPTLEHFPLPAWAVEDFALAALREHAICDDGKKGKTKKNVQTHCELRCQAILPPFRLPPSRRQHIETVQMEFFGRQAVHKLHHTCPKGGKQEKQKPEQSLDIEISDNQRRL